MISLWQFCKLVHLPRVPCLLITPEDDTLAIGQALEPQMNPTNNCLRLFWALNPYSAPCGTCGTRPSDLGFNVITTNDSEVLDFLAQIQTTLKLKPSYKAVQCVQIQFHHFLKVHIQHQ